MKRRHDSMEAGTENTENYVPGYDDNKNLTFNEGIVKKQLEEIDLLVIKDEYDQALKLMEGQLPILKSFEERFVDTPEREFKIFYEPFQQILFQYRFKPTVQIEPLPTVGIEGNLVYGSLLIGLKRYDEALECFNNVLKRNPVEPRAIYQRIETYKLMKDMDNFFKYCVEASKLTYRPYDVARLHRNFGYYCIEKKMYDLAMACYSMSLSYEKTSRVATAEMQYAVKMSEGKAKAPAYPDAIKMAEEAGIPFGVDKEVMSLAYTWGKNALDSKQYKLARYYIQIVANLTHNKQIQDLLESIPADSKQS